MAFQKNKSTVGKPDLSNWEDAASVSVSGKPRRGVFMDIIGLEGTGKSTLALTLAELGQVGYIDIDQSVDRARKPKGKKWGQVLPVRYAAGMGEEATKQTCGPVWLDLAKKVREASASWATGGIVIDTATEDWEVLRLGSFGTLNPKGNRMDRLYGPVNALFRSHLRSVYRANGKHLITIHQVKDEYKDVVKGGQVTSIRTGKQNRAGFKEIGYLADVVVRTFREAGEFKLRVEVCKLAPNGPDMEGTELEGDQLSFLSIMMMATDTEASEWIPKK